MNRVHWRLMLLLCLSAFALTACGGQEPEPVFEVEQPAPAPEALPETAQESLPLEQPSELVATGELMQVDLQANTFAIRTAEGNQENFAFSASTEVIGPASTQGLSSQQQGSQATVHYVLQGDQKWAVRIEIQ